MKLIVAFLNFANVLKTHQKCLVTTDCIQVFFINRTTFSPNLDEALLNYLLHRLLKKFGSYYDCNNNNHYRENHSQRKYYTSLKLT
jgi:hypothetical protein